MNKIKFKTIAEALSQPKSSSFYVDCNQGSFDTGNKESFYSEKLVDEHLTFDVSNNKVLVNVSLNGSIKYITIYRSCYRTNSFPDYWPGVWLYKDYTRWGPYSFLIKIGEETHDLSGVDWPFTTSLIDNIFPITELHGKKVNIKLITYAPISEDGKQRPRGVIYGAYIQNISSERIAGSVILPRMFNESNVIRKAGVDGGEPIICDIDMGFAGSKENADRLDFDLAPGQCFWAPAVLFSPAEPTLEEINEIGALEWLNSTWTYFRNMTGRLTIAEDKFTEEFFQRAVYQCFGSINMDGAGRIAGSNHGTYPPTVQTWMKDMYYSHLPLFMLEPDAFKEGMLWFLDNSIRHKSITFEGGVKHSLSNALTPVIMAGLYYSSTDDKKFFIDNIVIKDKIIHIMETVLLSREDAGVWLFPSNLISDGDAVGDYHTGSNICAWYCFESFSRILGEVYNESDRADEYKAIAVKVKAAIEAHTIIDGPFGKQYIEGVNKDDSVPYMYHEAEESDTTLMSFYGYQPYDHAPFKNYTSFAMTEHNIGYNPESRGIKWCMHADGLRNAVAASFPGYITGFANIVDAETMNGENGYFTEIKKLTDVDGSIWWWPYAGKGNYGVAARYYICGKCGWASGVFVGLFISEILGLRYDAPGKTLYFRPFSPSGDFTWKDFRLGSGCFSASYSRKSDCVSISVLNSNRHGIELELEAIIGENMQADKILIDGACFTGEYDKGVFLKQNTIRITQLLLSGEKKTVTILIK